MRECHVDRTQNEVRGSRNICGCFFKVPESAPGCGSAVSRHGVAAPLELEHTDLPGMIPPSPLLRLKALFAMVYEVLVDVSI